MLRRLVADAATYGAADVAVRALALIFIPIYTRLLAPEQFGVVDLSVALITLVTLTVGLEISQAAARMYPEAKAGGGKRAVASTSLLFGTAAYSAFLLLALAGGTLIADLVYGPTAPAGIAQIAVIAAWLAGLYGIAIRQLRWSLRPWAFVGVTTAHAVTSALVGLTLVLNGWGGAGLVAGYAAAYGVGVVLAVWLARDSYELRIDLAVLRRLLGFSAPLVISSAAVFVATYVDRIAISQLLGLFDVGVYGVGLRVASIVTVATVGVQLAMLPLTYSHYALPTTRDDLAVAFRVFVAGAILVSLTISLFAPELVAFFAPRDYQRATTVVPFLTSALLLTTMYTFAPGLSIAKRTRTIAVIYALAASVNVIGNIVLIPRVGILGAAYATLIGAAVVFVATMWMSQREYHVPHVWSRMAIALAIGVAGYVAVQGLAPQSIAARLLAIAAMLTAVVLLGLVRIHEVGRLATSLSSRKP